MAGERVAGSRPVRETLLRVLVGGALGACVVGALGAVYLTQADIDPPAATGMEAAVAIAASPVIPVALPATVTPTSSPTDRVDPAWAASVAASTGIPARAVTAYASAELLVAADRPECGLGWNTLAAIGSIESGHGTHGGSVLGDDGYPSPAIRGIPLDGNGVAAIRDTDGGGWDGDAVWDRAVGPLQFIPSTWAAWGADGNGDGVSDPNQLDDAALAAGRYLCASGSMATAENWRAAVFSYNHLESYVDDVAAAANAYAGSAAR